jgi:hypothetical protein
MFDNNPSWLVNSLMQEVARLPQLTELDVCWCICKTRVPIGLFTNLSKLSVSCSQHSHFSFNISQIATVISNSPRLRSLHVCYSESLYRQPTLDDFFAKVSANHPLCLEHLSAGFMDATVTRATLPHLTHLTLLQVTTNDRSIARSAWTSFRINNIKVSDVNIFNP